VSSNEASGTLGGSTDMTTAPSTLDLQDQDDAAISQITREAIGLMLDDRSLPDLLVLEPSTDFHGVDYRLRRPAHE